MTRSIIFLRSSNLGHHAVCVISILSTKVNQPVALCRVGDATCSESVAAAANWITSAAQCAGTDVGNARFPTRHRIVLHSTGIFIDFEGKCMLTWLIETARNS